MYKTGKHLNETVFKNSSMANLYTGWFFSYAPLLFVKWPSGLDVDSVRWAFSAI